MKIWEVKEEMALYDERNGRTITVKHIRTDSKTALCEVEEIGEETDTALYTLQELTHFKEI